MLNFEETRKVAMDFAHANGQNEGAVEVKAEVWFDAVKDFDAEDEAALRSFLSREFKRG